MSVSGIGTNTQVSQLAQQIASAIDTNADGQVTTNEFAAFLDQVLGSVGGLKSFAQGAATEGGGDPPQSGQVALMDPTQWTGDPSPNGVTFAGYSQLLHTDLTLDQLRTRGYEKYLVYDYLLTNKIEPNQTWAPEAARALNGVLGADVFTATDGETLSYGNEFVHTAPNGWGLQRGTYDPLARNEFFWGVYKDDV
jgi:hypothetical protein